MFFIHGPTVCNLMSLIVEDLDRNQYRSESAALSTAPQDLTVTQPPRASLSEPQGVSRGNGRNVRATGEVVHLYILCGTVCLLLKFPPSRETCHMAIDFGFLSPVLLFTLKNQTMISPWSPYHLQVSLSHPKVDFGFWIKVDKERSSKPQTQNLLIVHWRSP